MPSSSISRSLNALPPGTVLRDYVIESELGSGGFSIVYLARHHLKAEWLYAIKEFLPAELAVRAHGSAAVSALNTETRSAFHDGLQRFRDEAEQLRKFRNERYVVSCLNYFEENGTAYLVMDYDDGLPLSEFLEHREAAGQPFTEADLLAVVEPLLEGLEVVHRAGVLHRDIKPGNIFVRRQDDITGRPAHPVLIDFGAAKQNYLARHSRSQAPYTPGYAAYEQVSSMGEVGPWTDMYALGALMWRMVAGGSPGDSRLLVSDDAGADRVWSPTPRASEMRSYALHRGRPDPMVSAAELGYGRYSPHLLVAIDRCLKLYPEDRVQDCGELRNVLEAPGVALHKSETGSMSPIGLSEHGVADLPTSRLEESTSSGSIVAAPASPHAVQSQEQRRPLAKVRLHPPSRALWAASIFLVFALSVIVFQWYRQPAEQSQTVTPVSADANNENDAIDGGDVRSQADCALLSTDPGSYFSLANAQDVNRCLMTGADVRARYESGATALHIAAEFSAIPEVINTLVDAGASVNVRDGDGGTALHAAARRTDNPEVLSALINVGASINVRDEIGATPLHVAARDNDNPEVIRTLVNLGADVNAPAHSGTTSQRWVAGTTPLHVAAGYNDDPSVIHALVNLGADINAQTDSRLTPLHFAAGSNDNPEVIDALLNAGAILNARYAINGETALHMAAGPRGNRDVVDTLLNAGADVNARDDSGETALHIAAGSNDNPDTIETLLIADADIDARDDSGKTPLHTAARLNDNLLVFDMLLNAGADINAKYPVNGETALHIAAASNDNPAVIETMINAGADINAGDNGGDTPLHVAARSNDNPEVIDALLNAGADVNARNRTSDRTPLLLAARWSDNPDVIDALLNAGADINSRDFLGDSALDEARWNDNPAVREAIANAQAED